MEEGVFGKERDKGSDKGEGEWGRKGRCGGRNTKSVMR